MLFHNEWEVRENAMRYARHPVLSRATKFLAALVEETNGHSDGWPYWSAPAKAARKLMTLIDNPATATEAAYRAALAPIRAFYTRVGNAAGMRFPKEYV